MALNARELELIIIAKDRASSTIARVGGALTIMGAGISRLGMAWSGEMREMAMEAAQFSSDAALAFSQMFDKSGATVQDVNDMMARVARVTARPIEEMGDALFDVFSSMDVNVSEAENILTKVGQAAVAGQADMRAAMVPTIGLMNAYKLGAEDIDHVLDIQFETVRKGIITYEEFTQNIGKVIPAAVAAGQSMEDMGTAYSFLTRQGVNAAMASTSTARAMELLTRPNTIANLEEIGVVVRDNQGEFLSMSDIVGQLGKRMDGMTGPERKQAFQDIFGTGTIQARRFFDLALANWEEYLELQGQFEGSAGAMSEAYDIMFDEPLTKLQLLQNRWQILRKEIGDRVIPLLEQHVAPLLERILDMWEDLTEEQKDTVAEWLALGGVATTVLGAVTTFIGIVTLAAGIWKAFGVGLGTILAGASKALGIFGLIATAAFLIWQNWDTVVSIWEDHVVPVLEEIWEFLEPLVNALVDLATGEGLAFWETLVELWEELKEIGQELWENLDIEGGLERWREAWSLIGPIVEQAFDTIGAIISAAGEILRAIVEGITTFITGIWETFGEDIKEIASIVWNGLPGIVQGGLMMILGLLTFFEGLFTLDWEKMWEGIKLYFEGMWTQMIAIFEIAWGTIVTIAEALWREFQENIWQPFMDEITEIWNSTWEKVSGFFSDIWNSDIMVFARNVIGIFQQLFRIGLSFVWHLWFTIWSAARNFFLTVWNAITGAAATGWEFLRGLAANKWVRIAVAISNPVIALVILLRSIWNTIKANLSRNWDIIVGAARGAWLRFKAVILAPLGGILGGIAGFVGNVIGKLRHLWEKAQEWAAKIRDALSKINPAEWFSPPLTAQVASGFKTMTDQIIGDLKTIEAEVINRVGKVRHELGQMHRAEQDIASATRGASQSRAGMTQYNTEIHTMARNGQQVANELSWKLKLG